MYVTHRFSEEPNNCLHRSWVNGLQGAQKSIATTTSSPAHEKTLFAGSYDGRVTSYSIETGDITPIRGDPHVGQVVKLSSAGSTIYSAGFDDRVREINVDASGSAFS